MSVRQQVSGRVLVVTMDNASVRNALDAETMARLRDLFENIAYREPLPPEAPATGSAEVGPGGTHRPHVIVLRAAGPVFCAGAHLGEMKSLGAADYRTNQAAALEMGAMFRAVHNCPVPVVARVQGPCYGGGGGLVAACDLVVASPAAVFAFTEVRLGIVPGVIAPVVIERVGPAAARAAFLTGEPIDAQAARAMGLVDHLSADEESLDTETARVVEALLAGGAAALGRVKDLVDSVQSLGFARSAEQAARMIAEARTGPEGQAALASFAIREKAPWYSDDKWIAPAWPDAAKETP